MISNVSNCLGDLVTRPWDLPAHPWIFRAFLPLPSERWGWQ